MKPTFEHSTVKTGRLFIGERDNVRQYLRTKGEGYYVYILRRPDGRPFYVGKGKVYRLFQHINEARHSEKSHKLNVIRSIGVSGCEIVYELDSFHLHESAAHQREMELIRLLKRIHEGGYLTNRTAGGEGGSDPSPESREKHRQTLGGIPENDSDRAIVNRFVMSVAALLSVAPPKSFFIKPAKNFKARPTQKFPQARRGATLRPAMALIASAIKNGINISAGCRIPRLLMIDGVAALTENGVSCDIVTSNMATLLPATRPSDEAFVLNQLQIEQLITMIASEKLVEARLLGEVQKGG